MNALTGMLTVDEESREMFRSLGASKWQTFVRLVTPSSMPVMFAGLKTDGPFGGGAGEDMFRSLLTEAMARQVTRAGGVGVSDVVQREILKLQGLT